jgi:hypothetical protein
LWLQRDGHNVKSLTRKPFVEADLGGGVKRVERIAVRCGPDVVVPTLWSRRCGHVPTTERPQPKTKSPQKKTSSCCGKVTPQAAWLASRRWGRLDSEVGVLERVWTLATGEWGGGSGPLLRRARIVVVSTLWPQQSLLIEQQAWPLRVLPIGNGSGGVLCASVGDPSF